MATHRGEVNAVEQPVQLLHREFDHGAVLLGPDKAWRISEVTATPLEPPRHALGGAD